MEIIYSLSLNPHLRTFYVYIYSYKHVDTTSRTVLLDRFVASKVSELSYPASNLSTAIISILYTHLSCTPH